MRRKWMSVMLLTAMLASSLPFAAGAATLTWTMGSNEFTVDEKLLVADMTPMVSDNGVIIVPLRTIVESMGGTVKYDADSRTVRLEIGSQWAEIEVSAEPAGDVETGQFGDTVIDIGTVADGHLYLPLSLTAYTTGAKLYLLEDENGLPYRFFLHVRES